MILFSMTATKPYASSASGQILSILQSGLWRQNAIIFEEALRECKSLGFLT